MGAFSAWRSTDGWRRPLLYPRIGPETEVLITGNLGSDTFIIAGEITTTGAVFDEEGNPVILPEASRQTGSIQGKLTLIGGPMEGVDCSLSKAVTLLAETNRYLPTGTTASARLVDEELQTDRLDLQRWVYRQR